MWNQQKLKPFYQSDFFSDQSADRPLVEHTVPIGNGRTIKSEDPAYFTGLLGGKPIATIPVKAVQSFESPKAMLFRGRDRYEAYCSPCHGKTGDGNGFIMQRGLGFWQKLAASYHTAKLRKTPDGHIYDVLTNGYGVMYSYGSRVQDVNDRWAIVAYVRALQLTRANQPAAPDPYDPRTLSVASARTGNPPVEATVPAASPTPADLTAPDAVQPVTTPAPETPGRPLSGNTPANPGTTTPVAAPATPGATTP